MTSQEKLLQDELQKIETFIKSLTDQWAGVLGDNASPVVLKMMGDSLRPLLQGMLLAHATKASPTAIEDTLMNVFSVAFMTYYKRRYAKGLGPDPVIANAQNVVNTLATTLSAEIAHHFVPPAPVVPPRKKRH